MAPPPDGGLPHAAGDGTQETHQDLKALLGAWALGACSPAEAARVEAHLDDCAPCATEAAGFEDAVALLEPPRGLDLDPGLRGRVIADCLARRPADLPVPSWAAPLDAEAARLDALLHDMAEDEWDSHVELSWYEADHLRRMPTTVGGVLDHLLAADSLLARLVGLPDPLADGPGAPPDPVSRTLLLWSGKGGDAWRPWRRQTRALVRAAAGTGGRAGERTVPAARYSDPHLFPGRADIALSDMYLDRAFACWTHADDIAGAVDYPYDGPEGPHLRLLVDLAARRLPGSVARRRRAGLAASPARLLPAGRPGRTLHLEVEGPGGGDWYIPVDSPDLAVGRAAAREAVAHVALEDVVFCRLAAGRIHPEEAPSGETGDEAVIRDVLFAAAGLSRL
ncbi:zf-HC2 domain-containing protein [Streptomyces sp. RFCAC02]|uniref:zf-HC2 domain-containing protein n=1 Tax=Streptomyces sp. RFCAC02 TaxID=2499143 RepID=UPI00101F9E9E|nr:zf-HC2 domain-containing protein [Streptomyces sp. RFCAC02]